MCHNLAGTITSLQAKFLRTMNVLCVTYRWRIQYRLFNVDTSFAAFVKSRCLGNGRTILLLWREVCYLSVSCVKRFDLNLTERIRSWWAYLLAHNYDLRLCSNGDVCVIWEDTMFNYKVSCNVFSKASFKHISITTQPIIVHHKTHVNHLGALTLLFL